MVARVPCQGGSQDKMEENLISGETLPGSQLISHTGQVVSRGTPKSLNVISKS